MRIRSIKPEFWRSPDITSLNWDDRLVFIGLWSYVDDNGVGEDRISLIVADLFADDLARDARETLARVSESVERLSEAGRIIRYSVDGRDYLEISNWLKHQRIDKPNKARLPQHDAENSIVRESVARVSRDPRAWNRGTGEQGNRGTGEQISSSSAVAERGPDLDALFESAYSEWPKKVERKKSFEKFKQACKRRNADDLVADIRKFGQAYAATTDTQFVPALNVWLNGERWTDDLPQPRHERGTGHDRAYERQNENLSVIERMRALDAADEQRGLTA